MPSAASDNFRVVCIGGSAGALDGYVRILRHVPADTGMAFVIAPHRGFEHAHLLGPILSEATPMPVTEVRQGTVLAPNRVFLMPPGKDMTISNDGAFKLEATAPRRGWPVTINVFLLSLAEMYGSRAVAVILSGMDHDGSAALKAIRAAGGVTFAQSDPPVDSMPVHAVETGHIDYVLSPEHIGKALLDLSSIKTEQSSLA